MHDGKRAGQHDRKDQQGFLDERAIHRTPPAKEFEVLHRVCPCSSHSRIGLATKIDEKVPTTIPMTSARENPRKTWPPKRSSATAVSSVNPEVSTVRLSV